MSEERQFSAEEIAADPAVRNEAMLRTGYTYDANGWPLTGGLEAPQELAQALAAFLDAPDTEGPELITAEVEEADEGADWLDQLALEATGKWVIFMISLVGWGLMAGINAWVLSSPNLGLFFLIVTSISLLITSMVMGYNFSTYRRSWRDFQSAVDDLEIQNEDSDNAEG